jgi:hypothetical protein
MPSESLGEYLRNSVDDFPPGLDDGTIDRILTEPQQETLLEALAADAVDAAPLVGDLLYISRAQTAKEKGIDYPERPAYVENALSDLPPPADTIGDIIIAQNTMQYLGAEDELAGVQTPSAAVEDAAASLDDIIEDVTPGNGN